MMAKFVSAKEAVTHINSGDRVVIAHAVGEPGFLIDAMVENAANYRNVEIVHMVAKGSSQALQAKHPTR